ncbi:MAG: GNAT family N-acetyltransferase [Acidobacteriota bacterium]
MAILPRSLGVIGASGPIGAQGARLDLRPAQPGDAALLRQWRDEPSVRRHQPLGEVTLGQLRSDLTQQNVADLRRGRGQKFQWLILVEQRPAGWVTLVVANWEHGLAEIGYALSTPYQGRGLMVPALRLLVAEIFASSPLARLEARCSIENLASQRVLERVGFQREGQLRGYFVLNEERVDNFLYALLRTDAGLVRH